MKKLFKTFMALLVFFLLTHGPVFAQVECRGTFPDGSPRPLPSPPTPIQAFNVQLRTMSGGAVGQILPNTQYRLSITQPSSSDNSFWSIPAGESFGIALFANNSDPQIQGYALDAGPGQTRTFTITTDALGGIIVFDLRGGSGGGFFQTCRSDRTRISF